MNEDEDLITTVSEACGCSLAHATLALSKCRNNVEYAADWVLQNPEVPLPTPGVAVPRVPDSDETRQWRRFDTESKQCIAMMMYALNVHAWDSEDTNSFVPYDCLEDTMPFLERIAVWTLRSQPRETPSILRPEGSASSSSPRCFRTCMPLPDPTARPLFLEISTPNQGGNSCKAPSVGTCTLISERYQRSTAITSRLHLKTNNTRA